MVTRMTVYLPSDSAFHRGCPREQLAARCRENGGEVSIAESSEELRRLGAGAEVVVATSLPPDFLDFDPRLQWVHLLSAGLDGVDVDGILAAGVRLSNGGGTMAAEVAEHAFAMLLALTRRVPMWMDAQRRRDWADIRASTPPIGLSGLTVGLAGFGHIGREIARRATAFDMRVIALGRSPVIRDPDVRVFGPEQFSEFLDQSDVVVSSLPLTAQTRAMFNARAFSKMRRGAIFINVGRGATVDETALVAALQDGHLAGAASDVFTTEPLPPASRLWTAPNFLVSPHLGGTSQHFWGRALELLGNNLTRYRSGNQLLNEIIRTATATGLTERAPRL